MSIQPVKGILRSTHIINVNKNCKLKKLRGYYKGNEVKVEQYYFKDELISTCIAVITDNGKCIAQKIKRFKDGV